MTTLTETDILTSRNTPTVAEQWQHDEALHLTIPHAVTAITNTRQADIMGILKTGIRFDEVNELNPAII